jgi:hypothetical protein
MNNLQAYVKDTIDEALPDYDGEIATVVDAAISGINQGWWSDLIYTSDVLDMFKTFKKGIAKALSSYAEETGESVLDTVHIHNDFTSEDVILALVSTSDEIKENDTLTRAACWLVSFGVEYETQEYSRKLYSE